MKEIEQVRIAMSVQLMGYRKRLYQNTRSISGHTQISGTRVRQTRGKWYRHTCTIIPCMGDVVMTNVGLLRLALTNMFIKSGISNFATTYIYM